MELARLSDIEDDFVYQTVWLTHYYPYYNFRSEQCDINKINQTFQKIDTSDNPLPHDSYTPENDTTNGDRIQDEEGLEIQKQHLDILFKMKNKVWALEAISHFNPSSYLQAKSLLDFSLLLTNPLIDFDCNIMNSGENMNEILLIHPNNEANHSKDVEKNAESRSYNNDYEEDYMSSIRLSASVDTEKTIEDDNSDCDSVLCDNDILDFVDDGDNDDLIWHYIIHINSILERKCKESSKIKEKLFNHTSKNHINLYPHVASLGDVKNLKQKNDNEKFTLGDPYYRFLFLHDIDRLEAYKYSLRYFRKLHKKEHHSHEFSPQFWCCNENIDTQYLCSSSFTFVIFYLFLFMNSN